MAAGLVDIQRRSATRGSRGTDEAVALAMDRLDEFLGVAVVAESLPRRFHAACDGRIRNGAPLPDHLHDLFLGDEALPVRDEQCEQCEDLRLETHRLATGSKLDGSEVQLEVVETIEHLIR